MNEDRLLYLNENHKEVFKDLWSRDLEKKDDLKIECYKNAVVQNFNKDLNTLGVFDENLNPVILSESKFNLDNKELLKLDKIEYIDEEVIYIGHHDTHLGHFILESMDRLWIMLDEKYKDKKVVYISYGKLDPYLDILFLFGIKPQNIIRIKNKPTRFKNVIVPEKSIKNEKYYHKKYLEIFLKVSEGCKSKYKYEKIYLSRTKFTIGVKPNTVYGEKNIENVFRKNGYKIIYPERLSIKDQIAILKNCKTIAGVTGTALHLSIFANNNIKLICVNRTQDFKGFFFQIMIDKMKNIDSYYIDGFANIIPEKYYNYVHIVYINNYLKKFFYDNNIKFKNSDTMINKIDFYNYISGLTKIETDKRNSTINVGNFIDNLSNIKFKKSLYDYFMDIKKIFSNIINDILKFKKRIKLKILNKKIIGK